MISVEEALSRVLDLARPTRVERIPLRAAAGRVLAEPAVAARDQPPFAASAMDGYAISEADHVAGRTLAVAGTAQAGAAFGGKVRAGEAIRIFTGAPVPAGAGRVVLQEDVTRAGEMITLGGKLERATHVRARGQDFRAGDSLGAPRRMNARDLALIAAMNVPEVAVRARPVVALIATGDELVMPGETPRPDQIVASNSFALAAMAEAEGAEVRMLPIARDDVEALEYSFGLAEGADLIVTIGGASVGDHDLVAQVGRKRGLDLSFHKIAMRPGKPLLAGRFDRSVMLGLPGNPVSAIVCAHLFMLPLIRAMQGLPKAGAPVSFGRLAADVPGNGPRAHYMRARIERGDGLPAIRPFDMQDSALLRILSEADALLIRPADDEARHAGERVGYIEI